MAKKQRIKPYPFVEYTPEEAGLPGGSYLDGLPARGLTLEEWERIPKELREKAVNMGLYRLSTPAVSPESNHTGANEHE